MEVKSVSELPTYEEIIEAKLVSYTQPAEEIKSIFFGGAEDLIAWCARISNPESRLVNENASGLINYLIKHKHWSPLGMCDATVLIKTTRDISHQMVRHVSFTPQEFSQRYSNLTEMGEGFCIREARLQDHKNRQNSIEGVDEDIQREWAEHQKKVIATAIEAYDWAISKGIAKECARVVLPEGNTTTSLFFKGSIRSWIHYLELRGANGTQKEHMMIAKICASVISRAFPDSIARLAA